MFVLLDTVEGNGRPKAISDNMLWPAYAAGILYHFHQLCSATSKVLVDAIGSEPLLPIPPRLYRIPLSQSRRVPSRYLERLASLPDRRRRVL